MNIFENILNRPTIPQYAQEKFRATSSQMQQPVQQVQPSIFDKYMQDSSISANGKKAMQEDLKNGVITKEQADKIISDIYAKRQTQTTQNKPREGFVENVWGLIGDIVGGAVEQVPRTLGNVWEFLSKAWSYTPPALVSTAIKAWFSDKTFWQLREEQKKEAEKIWQVWEAWSQFIKQYWAYNPESTSAWAWRLWVEIGSSFIWPNKVWAIKSLWKIARPTQIAMEWWLAWAKYDIASKWKVTPQSVAVWAWWNLALAWAFRWWQKLAQIIKPKTTEQKILESVWQQTKWIVQGKVVKVPVPEKTIIEKATFWIWRNKDTKVLAWRALTPSYAGKTPKQMLKTIWDVEKNIKEFYSQVRMWKMKWDISSLEEWANTVISNLDDIWTKIWWAVESAKWRAKVSMITKSEIKRALTNKVEKRAWAYNPLKNFYEDTAKGLSLKDAFKAKKIYQAEITKLIKAWDAWTDSYQALVKWVQELSDNIDAIVEKAIWTKEFLQWKKQYKLLKSIASDISKSAVVEWRRSPNTFVEQLWTLEAIKEWITSPLSTAWKIYAKEIWELNTRGGAWKELIKIYDEEAIKLAKKTPKKIKVWR